MEITCDVCGEVVKELDYNDDGESGTTQCSECGALVKWSISIDVDIESQTVVPEGFDGTIDKYKEKYETDPDFLLEHIRTKEREEYIDSFQEYLPI